MLCVLENESAVSPVDTTPKRKRTRKKKKKQRNKAPTSASTEDATVEPVKETESAKNVQMPLVDPRSIEKAKEHTRKFILAGTIIDDVLDNVFAQLGLNTPPPSLDNHMIKSLKNNQTRHYRTNWFPLPMATSQASGFECPNLEYSFFQQQRRTDTN